MRHIRRRHILSLLSLFALTLSTPVHAHAMFGSAAPFWSGALHFLVTPLALAAVAGLALLLVGVAEDVIFYAVILAAATTFAAAELSPWLLQAIAPLGVAAIGLLAAAGRPPARWLACASALVSGVSAGIAIGWDEQGWGASLGAAVALLIVASWLATALVRMQAVEKLADIIPFARRLMGGCLAAIALLFGALSVV